MNKRTIEKPPLMEGFRPFGIPRCKLKQAVLLYEEYEAIRLADYLGLDQEHAAKLMDVSRPTFTRIYERARHTVATALVEGRVILIDGGHYQTNGCWYRCQGCSKLSRSPSNQTGCPFCRSSALQCLNSDRRDSETGSVCSCPRSKACRPSAQSKTCQKGRCRSCEAGAPRQSPCPHPKPQRKKTDK